MGTKTIENIDQFGFLLAFCFKRNLVISHAKRERKGFALFRILSFLFFTNSLFLVFFSFPGAEGATENGNLLKIIK